MTWEPLGATRRNINVPAAIATSAGEGRLPPFLHITLRTGLLPALPFITPRGSCQVLFGRGDNSGRLRIVAGDASIFFAMGRKAHQGDSLTVRVKLPDGIKPAKRLPAPVEFSHGEDWLELRLPSWAVAVEVVPAKPARTSIMDRVPDPVAPLRGARP